MGEVLHLSLLKKIIYILFLSPRKDDQACECSTIELVLFYFRTK